MLDGHHPLEICLQSTLDFLQPIMGAQSHPGECRLVLWPLLASLDVVLSTKDRHQLHGDTGLAPLKTWQVWILQPRMEIELEHDRIGTNLTAKVHCNYTIHYLV